MCMAPTFQEVLTFVNIILHRFIFEITLKQNMISYKYPCEIIFTLITGIHALFSYASKDGYNFQNCITIYTVLVQNSVLLCPLNY